MIGYFTHEIVMIYLKNKKATIEHQITNELWQ